MKLSCILYRVTGAVSLSTCAMPVCIPRESNTTEKTTERVSGWVTKNAYGMIDRVAESTPKQLPSNPQVTLTIQVMLLLE